MKMSNVRVHSVAGRKVSGKGPRSHSITEERTEVIKGRGTMVVVVAGGGPVGLLYALTLWSLFGPRIDVRVYDGRWKRENGRTRWKGLAEGNNRRRQVVTLQSLQYSKLPQIVREALFESKVQTSQMWPATAASPAELGPPINIRISDIEDVLLDLAGKVGIRLRPERFSPEVLERENCDLLAICDGAASRTREHYIEHFGAPNTRAFAVGDEPLEDVVLGLYIKSKIPEPTSVLLTIAQNRFLLNSMEGQGYLNMRLTPSEAARAFGINFERGNVANCVQSRPCFLSRTVLEGGKATYQCPTHRTVFAPQIDPHSPLWPRILDGLALYGASEEDLEGITAFRLSMVERPRFTAEIIPRTARRSPTYACLLGDAANAIHFWPGRGLNSGIASAIALARCTHRQWNGRHFRDADFSRFEAFMAMLQYRQKRRAWRAMVQVDAEGKSVPIQDVIEKSHASPVPRKQAIRTLLERIEGAKRRLEGRLNPLPTAEEVTRQLERLSSASLVELAASGAWDTRQMGGEEVDLDLILPPPERA